ncbi:MAG: ATP-dependent zinc metalloprotease FtsH, partial [Microbacterium sp.]
IFANVRKLPKRPQWLSSDGRPVSDLPPVDVPRRASEQLPVAANAAEPQAAPGEAQPGPAAGNSRPATA